VSPNLENISVFTDILRVIMYELVCGEVIDVDETQWVY